MKQNDILFKNLIKIMFMILRKQDFIYSFCISSNFASRFKDA